jgi:hypothetical protein
VSNRFFLPVKIGGCGQLRRPPRRSEGATGQLGVSLATCHRRIRCANPKASDTVFLTRLIVFEKTFPSERKIILPAP